MRGIAKPHPSQPPEVEQWTHDGRSIMGMFITHQEITPMAHRINILIDDTVWPDLAGVPKGERSRVVNHALAEWFQVRRRERAARQMDMLRSQMPQVSTEEIVSWVREDRDRVP